MDFSSVKVRMQAECHGEQQCEVRHTCLPRPALGLSLLTSNFTRVRGSQIKYPVCVGVMCISSS